MAENSKKSKDLDDYLKNFDHLKSKLRKSIKSKIGSILAPVSIEVALNTFSGYLENEIPKGIWEKFFRSDSGAVEENLKPKIDQGGENVKPEEIDRKNLKNQESDTENDKNSENVDTEDSEAPEDQKNSKTDISKSENRNSLKIDQSDSKNLNPDRSNSKNPKIHSLSLDHLSLHELIMISLTLPPLKTKWSPEEKRALENFQNILDDVEIEFLLKNRLKHSSQEQRNRLEKIESEFLTALNEFGADEENGENEKEEESVPKIFLDQILKKIDKKLKMENFGGFTEEERKILMELVKDGRENARKDSSSPSLTSSIRTAIEQSLICGYCQKLPKDPRILPCLHLCCSPCLKNHFGENSTNFSSSSGSTLDKQTISCPLCHTRISMPTVNHVDHLPHGFSVESILKLYESVGSPKKDLECTLCLNRASHICLICADFYCSDHISVFNKHGESGEVHTEMITPLSIFSSADQILALLYRFCPQHRQRISHFCPGCRVPLCSHNLCVDWHSKHVDQNPGLRLIDEVVVEEHQKLAIIENQLCKKAEKIRNKIGVVEKNQITVAEVQENVRQSVEKYFSDIEEKIAKQKVIFLSDLDKSAAQCFQNDETIHSRLQSWSEKADKLESEFRQYLDNRLSTSNSATVTSSSANASVSELASLRFRVLELLSDSCSGALVASTKRLSYPETRLRELQHQVGTLQSNITTAPAGRGWESLVKFTTGMTPSAIGIPLHFVIDPLKLIAYVVKGRGYVATSQVISFDLKQTENRLPTLVCDAGTRSFESLAVDTANRRLFAAELPQNVLELPTMKMKKFSTVRVYDFNNIGVCNLSRTAALDHLNTYSKSIIKYVSDRFYICDGVCVCEYDASFEFKLIRKFNFHNMLEIADFAVEPKRDFLYVVDGKKHCLLIFNCQHQIVKSVGDLGVTPGKFDQPSGVALDEYGHVFVADAANFRVQVFDVDGKFLRMIQYPQAIKEIAQAPSTVSDQKSGAQTTLAKVALQIGDDCLYMLDSRSEHLWRYRYM